MYVCVFFCQSFSILISSQFNSRLVFRFNSQQPQNSNCHHQSNLPNSLKHTHNHNHAPHRPMFSAHLPSFPAPRSMSSPVAVAVAVPVAVPAPAQTVPSTLPRRPSRRSDTYPRLLLILFFVIVLAYYHPPFSCTSTFLFPTTTTITSTSMSPPSLPSHNSPALTGPVHIHVHASAVAYGNAADASSPPRSPTTTNNTNWWIGHFISPSDILRHNTHVETKWAVHPQGRSRPSGFVKNNMATSMAVLVSGAHRIVFQHPPASVTLTNPGDYVIWGPNVLHSWTALLNHTTVLTIRWPSIPNDRN